MSDSLRPRGLYIYSQWDSPGQNTGVGSLSLLQRIVPTQESNQGLLHCRQVLYQLSYTKRHASVPGSTRNRDGPPSLQSTQVANPRLVPIATGTGWPRELRNLPPQPGQVPGGAFGPENTAPTRHPSSITLSAWAPCIRKASEVVQTLQTSPARAGDPGLTPGSGRCPGGGHGHPLQRLPCRILEKPGRGLQSTRSQSRTRLKELSRQSSTFVLTHLVHPPSTAAAEAGKWHFRGPRGSRGTGLHPSPPTHTPHARVCQPALPIALLPGFHV